MSLVKRNLVIKITNTQPAFTCPKKHQNKAPIMPKAVKKDTSATPMALF